VATAAPGPGSGLVPAHVAWVGRPRTGGPGPGGERSARALSALVDCALGLGVGWITFQEPSAGRGLRERAAELATRGIALSSTTPPSRDGSPGPPDLVAGPRDLVEGPRDLVEPPSLRVLLAEERSGRRDLVGAVRELAARGVRPKDVDEAAFGSTLGVPDVDLLVLTGGDRRVPDLLVWQVAYSEIVVLEEPWPEVGEAQFRATVAEYQRRDRRYGGLVASR
jgi:hypothetical protein